MDGLVPMVDIPIGDQTITPTRCGFQHVSVGAQRLTNSRDMHLERVFLDDRARPNSAHQIVFGDELSSRPDQNLDDLERTSPDGNARAASTQFPPHKIDFPSLRFVNELVQIQMLRTRGSSLRWLSYPGQCNSVAFVTDHD